MLSQLDPSRDLRLSGQVIYTGKSSMEVAVTMQTIGMGREEETVLLGELLCLPISRDVLSLIHRPFFDGLQGCS